MSYLLILVTEDPRKDLIKIPEARILFVRLLILFFDRQTRKRSIVNTKYRGTAGPRFRGSILGQEPSMYKKDSPYSSNQRYRMHKRAVPTFIYPAEKLELIKEDFNLIVEKAMPMFSNTTRFHSF